MFRIPDVTRPSYDAALASAPLASLPARRPPPADRRISLTASAQQHVAADDRHGCHREAQTNDQRRTKRCSTATSTATAFVNYGECA
jgi:hypothetical protein